MVIEGSGFGSRAGSGSGSIPLTSGSGSGSWGPKNMWIRWIRIRIRIRNTCCNWLIYGTTGRLIDWLLCRQPLSQLWARRTTGSRCNWLIYGTTGRLIDWFLCRQPLSQLWARRTTGSACTNCSTWRRSGRDCHLFNFNSSKINHMNR